MAHLTRAAAIDCAAMILGSAGVEVPRSDAQRLLCHVLQISRSILIAYSDTELSPNSQAEFNRLVARRARREPLPYILGQRPFLDFDLLVAEGVLIPRPETELLVEVVATRLMSASALPDTNSSANPLAIDVGTGTGAVAAGLALRHPNLQVLATDISPVALEVARRNIERLRLSNRVHLLQADLLPTTSQGRADDDWPAAWQGLVATIVSNPPYIPTDEIDDLQPEVSVFEPRLALDGGPDGLQIIRRLVQEAREWLKPGGLLAFEVGAGQSPAALQLLCGAGYGDCEVYKDLADIERVVTGSWYN